MGNLEDCNSQNCIICNNEMNKVNSLVKSSVTSKSYKVNKNLNCINSGIYVITGGCLQQYSGKTTVPFCNRTYEHFHKLKQCTLFLHRSAKCKDLRDCSIAFAENCLDNIVFQSVNIYGIIGWKGQLKYAKHSNVLGYIL